MHFSKDKANLRQAGENFLGLIHAGAGRAQVLREYNLWYSKAIEFATLHGKCRLQEFQDLHAANQAILTNPSSADLKTLEMNVTIQIIIIEGCEDHSYHLV